MGFKETEVFWVVSVIVMAYVKSPARFPPEVVMENGNPQAAPLWGSGSVLARDVIVVGGIRRKHTLVPEGTTPRARVTLPMSVVAVSSVKPPTGFPVPLMYPGGARQAFEIVSGPGTHQCGGNQN